MNRISRQLWLATVALMAIMSMPVPSGQANDSGVKNCARKCCEKPPIDPCCCRPRLSAQRQQERSTQTLPGLSHASTRPAEDCACRANVPVSPADHDPSSAPQSVRVDAWPLASSSERMGLNGRDHRVALVAFPNSLKTPVFLRNARLLI